MISSLRHHSNAQNERKMSLSTSIHYPSFVLMLPIALLLVAGYTVGIMSRTIYQDLSGTFQKQQPSSQRSAITTPNNSHLKAKNGKTNTSETSLEYQSLARRSCWLQPSSSGMMAYHNCRCLAGTGIHRMDIFHSREFIPGRQKRSANLFSNRIYSGSICLYWRK